MAHGNTLNALPSRKATTPLPIGTPVRTTYLIVPGEGRNPIPTGTAATVAGHISGGPILNITFENRALRAAYPNGLLVYAYQVVEAPKEVQ